MALGAGFFFCTSSRISGGAARPRLVSNVSVFSRKRTFRSPHIFESNENWGFGRDCWASVGLDVRALLAFGTRTFQGRFRERNRSAFRVAFHVSGAVQISFLVLSFQTWSAPDGLRKFSVAFQILRIPSAVSQHVFGVPRTVE